MRMTLGTPDISLDEFQETYNELYGDLLHENSLSEELLRAVSEKVFKKLISKIVKSEYGEFSELQITKIFNDPLLTGFDESKPIAANYEFIL